jgi:hypothetical protein
LLALYLSSSPIFLSSISPQNPTYPTIIYSTPTLTYDYIYTPTQTELSVLSHSIYSYLTYYTTHHSNFSSTTHSHTPTTILYSHTPITTLNAYPISSKTIPYISNLILRVLTTICSLLNPSISCHIYHYSNSHLPAFKTAQMDCLLLQCQISPHPRNYHQNHSNLSTHYPTHYHSLLLLYL